VIRKLRLFVRPGLGTWQGCGIMGCDLNSEEAKSLRKIKRKDKKVFKKIYYNLSVVDRVVVQFLG